MPSGWSVSRAATLVVALTAVSTLLGFARDVVIAGVFGAGSGLDAYLVAQGLMNIALGFVAGAMAKALVPVVSREAAAEEGRCPGHRSVDVALTVTLIVLGLASLLIFVLVSPVLTVLAPGFDAREAAVAEDLTRIVLLATVLIAGTNLLAAVAQAHGRFGWSSLQGVPFNLVMIVSAAVFGPRYGVTALAVGFVVGSAARLLLQLPPLRAVGTRLRPRLDIRSPGFVEVARLVPALLVGSAVANVNTLVDRAVGSTLAEGSITALSYGWRLVDLGNTLVVASLLVPLYPAMSAATARRDELRRLVGRGLAAAVTLLAPLTVTLVVAATPVVAVVFGYGAFDTADVEATATAVFWYAPALLALGCREVVARASYAVGDARSPVVVAVVAMVVNVVGDLTLGRWFGIPGIAVSTTASLLLAAAGNLWLLRRRHDAVGVRPFAALLARAFLLSLVAGAAGAGVTRWLDAAQVVAVGQAALGGVVVMTVYVAGLWALRAPERVFVLSAVKGLRAR